MGSVGLSYPCILPTHSTPTLPSVYTRARRLIEGWQLSLHYTLLHAWCMYSDVIGMFDGTSWFCVTHILVVNDDESNMGWFNSSVYAWIHNTNESKVAKAIVIICTVSNRLVSSACSFYFFASRTWTQLLTHISVHGAKTSEKSIIGRRSRGRSIFAATDNMFMKGSMHHVKKKENIAAMIAHTTVAGNPTTTTHPWYTPSLVEQ